LRWLVRDRVSEDGSGTTIKKLVQTLRAARSATIEINGQRLTLDPELTETTRAILNRLEEGHEAIGTSQDGLGQLTGSRRRARPSASSP